MGYRVFERRPVARRRCCNVEVKRQVAQESSPPNERAIRPTPSHALCEAQDYAQVSCRKQHGGRVRRDDPSNRAIVENKCLGDTT